MSVGQSGAQVTTLGRTEHQLPGLAWYVTYYARAIRREAMARFSRFRRGGSRKPKLVLLDPGLTSYAGHHAEFAGLLETELGSEFDFRVYSNFRARTRLVLRFGAQPIFHDTVYAPVGGPDFETVYRAMSRSLGDALARVRREDLGPETIVVMHTLTVFQLGALATWYVGLPADRRPRLFLQFQFPVEFGVAPAENWPRARELARDAAETLARNGIVRFASNSRPLADLLAEQLGQPFTLMPLPVRWTDLAENPAPPERLTFGFFGGLRPEKGAALMAAALPAFAARHPDAHFIVHAPADESDAAAVRALASVPQVELIRTSFRSKHAYLREFLRAGCILLPYDPGFYAMRSSGILVEALGLGRLIIATSGTWLAEELRDRPQAAVVLSAFTAEALMEGLEAAYTLMRGTQQSPVVDREIVRKNSPSAFAAELIEAVGG